MTLLAATAARALVAPVATRSPTQLRAIDAGVLEQGAGFASIPTVFVGAGAFLLGREPEKELEGLLVAEAEEGEEVDIYRDTALRYAGYANEVGEAFAPLTPGW